jgi:pyridinium-3,5-bisthiocarboxylic acid mononucleotide nickel chelatase
MRIGYLECFAGLSGDMLLGALMDAGVPAELLAEAAASLDLHASLRFDRADRSGILACKARVLVDGRDADAADSSQHHTAEHEHRHDHGHAHSHAHTHAHGRTLPAIRGLLQAAPISPPARTLALRAFELLGSAEAAIHGVSIDQVHFHEVGAVDAIVDIACAAVGLTALGVERWYCSPLNVGSGFVDCAHGRFPVPAPATAALLRGVPTYSEGPAMELVTPTGAALLRALDCEFTRPAATFAGIGYGAGSRNPPRFPNVLRLSVGQMAAQDLRVSANTDAAETIALVECAVDDQSPQVLAHALQLALEQGALDTMSVPVVMKKGRLGTLLTILCHPHEAASFAELLFRETSTLGVRTRIEQRVTLERRHVTVATTYGEIRIKTAMRAGRLLHAQAEYEDCQRSAREHDVPLKQVLEAAMAAWSQRETLAHASA